MVWNISYWAKVGQRILYVLLLLLGLYIGIKLSIFYMPFLVAFIISLIIEPAIKFIMKKTGTTRRTSSIIIFTIDNNTFTIMPVMLERAPYFPLIFKSFTFSLSFMNNFINKSVITFSFLKIDFL